MSLLASELLTSWLKSDVGRARRALGVSISARRPFFITMMREESKIVLSLQRERAQRQYI
jgi:hypothetical protein